MPSGEANECILWMDINDFCADLRMFPLISLILNIIHDEGM